jgi:hypothetical protein
MSAIKNAWFAGRGWGGRRRYENYDKSEHRRQIAKALARWTGKIEQLPSANAAGTVSWNDVAWPGGSRR